MAEDAYVHGYKEIKNVLNKEIEAIILLFCNGATVLNEQIDYGVEALRNNHNLDSACTRACTICGVHFRAKKINKSGMLAPFIDPSYFGEEVNCDRGSQVILGMLIVQCSLSGQGV